MQFSWMIIKLHVTNCFKTHSPIILRAENQEPSLKLRRNYIEYSIQSHNNFTKILNNHTEHQYYRCDPDNHVEYVTYNQLTNFDQGYIIHESNMDDNTCSSDCKDIKEGTTKTCSHGKFPCYLRKCNKFYDCEDRGHMHACFSKDQSPNRRYEFVDMYGEGPSTCDGSIYEAFHNLRHFYKCKYCFCYCDDISERSDRIISLQRQESNISANEVITGIRVIKLRQIFYWQIQVGKLLPMQIIDQDTVRWIPIKPIKNINLQKMKGPDYYILTRNVKMDLDILYFKQNEILTGNRI